jgi:hypothetical protein
MSTRSLDVTDEKLENTKPGSNWATFFRGKIKKCFKNKTLCGGGGGRDADQYVGSSRSRSSSIHVLLSCVRASVCGSKATVAGIYEKGEERRHGWWWWWKGLHGDYSASRAPAQDLFFLSPHFVFIYSALLLFLFRRRGYILLARLIVASDVLVQTTCHERDGDRAAGARDHLVHTRTHIRRENTYTQSLGATGWLAGPPL